MTTPTNDRREVLAAVLPKCSIRPNWNGDLWCPVHTARVSDPPYCDELNRQAAALDAALAAQEGERGGAEVAAAVEAIHGKTHWCNDDEEQALVYEPGTEWWPCPTFAALADSAGALAKHDVEVLRAAVGKLRTHDGTPVTAESLRYAATHEALCRSWIFDVLTGLADRIEAP